MIETIFTGDELRQIHADLCRDNFVDFIEAVQPDYVFNWHHLVLIDALQRLADREFERLIVMMPPRHGKSQLVSRLFPAWAFARDRQEQIILSSYSLDLASAMNRDCQRIITGDEYRRLFPETRLNERNSAAAVRNNHRFDIVGETGYFIAAGVGGGITGAGATIGIIDDPVKNAQEADSQTYRNTAWEWYTTTFKTRFEPNAVEVICQTRWHEDDLTGRILKQIEEEGSEVSTEIISLPALCEHPEQYRDIGDALWPGKYSRGKLLKMQNDLGSRAWGALYQQRPAPEEGNLIKRDWFDVYDPKKVDLSGTPVNFFFDTAYTDKEANDPTAGIAYVKKGDDYYVLECRAEWLEFLEQTKFILDFCSDNGYTVRSLARVEPKATGKSIVQVLKRQTKLNIVESEPPKDSKIARVNSIAARLEAGRVLLPKGQAWVAGFLDECAAFPNGAHDDRVDCLCGMILSEENPVRGFRRRVSSIN
jgi:predicted phage terminase large subunit-like protein